MEQKDFVASAFRTFDLKLNTLAERIAFQKTIYILQEFGSGTNFNFVWHNFGPYSSELARIGFSLSEADKADASMLNGESFEKFVQFKSNHRRDSRFLEMVADIIFLKNKEKNIGDEKLFELLITHQSYLNDKDLFNLVLQRLKSFSVL